MFYFTFSDENVQINFVAIQKFQTGMTNIPETENTSSLAQYQYVKISTC